MRAKNPSTLVDALRFLEREELVRYRQRQPSSATVHQKPTMSQKTYIMPNPTLTQRPSSPSQPINIQLKPIQQKFYTNQQVFEKPRNVFKPGQSILHNKSTPMSIYILSRLEVNNDLKDENPLLDKDDNQIIQNLLENPELNKALNQIFQDTRDDDNLSMQVNLDQDEDHVIGEPKQNQNANETPDEITQHTQEKNISPINIEITEKPLNRFKNQIIFKDMRFGTPYYLQQASFQFIKEYPKPNKLIVIKSDIPSLLEALTEVEILET
ncbi:hypothetical protein ILUMI_16891 [Ignelater luminosus]|uniref:Uncharacterized protein n=1 Tax=Ignelater luminosus TaxID=2038154 RepID=A0A8K0CS16_IGNLU|nr:hypothetical protein ILUMI_16891 [Ignelater luminosus]